MFVYNSGPSSHERQEHARRICDQRCGQDLGGTQQLYERTGMGLWAVWCCSAAISWPHAGKNFCRPRGSRKSYLSNTSSLQDCKYILLMSVLQFWKPISYCSNIMICLREISGHVARMEASNSASKSSWSRWMGG